MTGEDSNAAVDAARRHTAETAHDLRTLLTVIHGCAGLASRDLGVDPSTRDLLSEILAVVERAGALVQTLANPGQPAAAPAEPLNLGGLVRRLAPMLGRVAGSHIRLHHDVAAAPVWVRATAGQIEQVLMNLVANARDAMPAGGSVLVSVWEATDAGDHAPGAAPTTRYAVLAVGDTGDGIDAAIGDRLFEPFVSTKPAEAHAGLGLAIVQRLVGELDGRIRVASMPGRGTTFEIRLPIAEAPTRRVDDEPHVAASSAGPLRTILLVENERPLRALLAMTLRRHGHTVLEAENAADAIASVEHHGAVALVITDLDLPGASGSELVARLTARDPGLRVLYISGAIDESTDDLDAPLLQKPFALAALVQTVHELLAPVPVERRADGGTPPRSYWPGGQ